MWGIIRKRAAENRPLWPNAVPLRLRRNKLLKVDAKLVIKQNNSFRIN